MNPQATFIPKKSIGWTFPSTVTAFGGDIQNVLNTSGSLRITGDFDGNGDATINVNTGFIGIVGNKPFSAILWDGDAGGTNFKVDNFSLAVVPLPTLSLKAGFNLLTYPVEPVGGFSCQAFKTQLGAGMLGRLDSASQVFQSCGTSQFPIQAGEGYVIEMPEDRILEVSGEPSCPTIDLAAGLNLVGIPTPAAGFSCYALLQTLGGPTIVTVVQRYAVDSGAYESCGYAEGDVVPRGVDFPIRAEEAYLISLQSPWPEFWVCRARA